MHSITIISATNRPNSNTEKIANYYLTDLKTKGLDAEIFNLRNLPESFLLSDLYGKRSVDFQKIIDDYIEQQSRFIFIVPEYNGSFAGILKLFLEAIHPKLWAENKACIVGVSSGRAGNLRGLDHLTGVLNYLKMHVYHNKLPISRVDTLLNDLGELTDAETQKAIDLQVEGFLKF